MSSLPWPVLLAELAGAIHTGEDEFRARLMEEGYICDALDTMNQWYFAIVIKTSPERNEVKIHYDGWPPKYDEWIDRDSHRLQPFLTRARLAARPHVTRPHPGHAIHSINLDTLLGVRPPGADAAGAGGPAAALAHGAQPSPSTSQYTPSAANAVSSANAQDLRQLAFDLSAAIASMGESAGSRGGSDCSSQLHSFALKLHQSIDSYTASDLTAPPGSLDAQQVSAFAITDRMQNLIAPHASQPLTALQQLQQAGSKHPSVTMIPIQLTVNTQNGQSSSGPAAIAAACAAGILPHPAAFMAQSISGLSCLADLSARNHAFIDEIALAYQQEQRRTLTLHVSNNFCAGLSAELFRNVPFAPPDEPFEPRAFRDHGGTAAIVPSLRAPVPAAASLPLCSYLLSLVQQQLLHKALLPAAARTRTQSASRTVSAARPRGRIAEVGYLVPLNAGERSYVQEVREFLRRIVALPLPPAAASSSAVASAERREVRRLRHAALSTFVHLSFALSTQEAVEECALELLRFFRSRLEMPQRHDDSADDDRQDAAEEAQSQRELLHSLAALTQQWSRCVTADAQRLLGQQREEVATGLSEAKEKTLADLVPATVSAPASAPAPAPALTASATSAAATSLLTSFCDGLAAAPPSWAALDAAAASPPSLAWLPAPSALQSCPGLHAPAVTSNGWDSCVRLCADSAASYLFALTPDFGLVKMGSGEGGSVAGRIVRQNMALALHAPFGQIAFVPAPLPSPSCYGTRGHVLLRSQLCPDRLLLIDADTLHFTGAFVPLGDGDDGIDGAATLESASSPSVEYSYELSFGGSSSSASAALSPGAATGPTSSLGGGYDPSSLPPVVYPSSWRSDVATEGFICDAQDSEGDWYPAAVVGVSHPPSGGVLVEALLTVQYDGWSSAHNSRIPCSSSRLAPFGSRINTLQRFSRSNQGGDHLLDLANACRAYRRATGREVFAVPNVNTPEFREGLRVGSVVDARDSSEMWYAAEIVKIDSGSAAAAAGGTPQVTVRYDGWAASYNETVALTSSRLAPFLTYTSLATRLRDPQQSPSHALNLDAAIAEVRGRAMQAAHQGSVDARLLTPAFRALFDRTVVRGSAWSIGSCWTVRDGAGEIALHLDSTGFALVDAKLGTRKKVFVNVVQKEGVMADRNAVAAEENSSSSGSANANASAAPAGSSVPAAKTAALSAAASALPRLLSAREARSIRATAGASLPFFFVDSPNGAAGDEASLVLVELQRDRVRYAARWASFSKADLAATGRGGVGAARGALVTRRVVALQETLPIHPVSTPPKDLGPPGPPPPASKKDAKGADASSRDLDRFCHSCGTFLTAPLPHPLPAAPSSGSLTAPPSYVQLHSPGVRSFVRCSHSGCEKAKMLLCVPCQQFGSFPTPHDSNHTVMRLEHAREKKNDDGDSDEEDGPSRSLASSSSSASSTASAAAVEPAPVLLCTRAAPIMAMFDARDDTLILAPLSGHTQPAQPGGSRALDFRTFSAHTGELLSAPTPQSNATVLFVHAHLSDHSLCAPGTNPRAAESTVFKLNSAGLLGRSVWANKSPWNNPRLHPSSLLFQLPPAHSSVVSLLSATVGQMLASVVVVEQNQQVLLENFARVGDVVHEVASIYLAARAARDDVGAAAASSSAEATIVGADFDALEQLFLSALTLLTAYLTQMHAVWPLVRAENPITSRAVREQTQRHKRRLRTLLFEQVGDALRASEALHESNGRTEKDRAVWLQLCQLATFFGFFFDSWMMRLKFVRGLIDSLPSTRQAQIADDDAGSSGVAASATASSAVPSSSPAAAIDDSTSLSWLMLRHLLHAYFLRQWCGNPAGPSASPTGHAFFVDLEVTSEDLGIVHAAQDSPAATGASVAPSLSSSSAMGAQPVASVGTSTATVAASMFGAPFRELLDGCIDFLWPATPQTTAAAAVAQPSAPQLVLTYLLMALQFHLCRMVPSPLAVANSAALVNPRFAAKSSTVLPGDTSVQFSRAKPCAALLMHVLTAVFGHLGETLAAHAPRSDTAPLRLAESAMHLYSFSAFTLARLNLKLAAAPDVIALLPVVFGVAFQLDAKFDVPGDDSLVAVEPSRAVVCAGSLSLAVLPGSATLLAHLSALVKTALVSLLRVLYPASGGADGGGDEVADLSSGGVDGGGGVAGPEEDRMAHLQELSSIAAAPLPPPQQSFLVRFLSCNEKAAATRDGSPPALSPELLFSLLLRQGLLEMGGGASGMELDFAWPMERAAAAVIMRYMTVAPEGEPNDGGESAGALSPKQDGSASAAAGGPTPLLTLAYHFSHSLDIHVLLAKSARKNTRVLVQAETPSWLRQLVYALFNSVRTPLLERIRAQATAAPAPSPLPSPATPLVVHSENKDSAEPKVGGLQRSPSPDALPEVSPSPPPNPESDKLRPDSHTRAVVAQWLLNAQFLLQSDFSGTSGAKAAAAAAAAGADHLSPASWRARLTPRLSPLLTPSSASRSPRPTPLVPLAQLALGATQQSSGVALVPFQPADGGQHGRSLSSLLAGGGGGAVTDEEDSSDDDAGFSPPAGTIPLVRSLSDRRVAGSSPSASAASRGVFGHALAGSAAEAIAAPATAAALHSSQSTSTAAHSLFAARTRRHALRGSSAWLVALIRHVSAADRSRMEGFMARLDNAAQLTRARVELLRLINAHMFESNGAETDARLSPLLPLTAAQLFGRSVVMDRFLPLLWAALSPPSNTASTVVAAAAGQISSAVPASASSARVHLLFPSARLSQLNEKAFKFQRGGEPAALDEEHTVLLSFLKGLAAWLDAAVAAMDVDSQPANSASSSSSSAASTAPWLSPQHQHRLRLVLHFLCCELHSTARDRAALLSSGALAALVRFAFHPRIAQTAALAELARVAWTVFSFLIANVLAGSGSAVGSVGAAGATARSSLLAALRPLSDSIGVHLRQIGALTQCAALQLQPPSELLAHATRLVPAPLDLERVAVDMLLDAKDKTGAWFPARVVKIERRLGGVEAWVHFSGWPEHNNEWIPLRSGKLAPLFSNVDVSAYEANGRPNKHRLDLSAQIAAHRARMPPPLSDEAKAAHRAQLQRVQIDINEKIVVTVNMIRIVCAVAPVDAGAGVGGVSGFAASSVASPRLRALPSPSSNASAPASAPALAMLSSFLRTLASAVGAGGGSAIAPTASRSVPPILQLELVNFLRKSLASRFGPADFDAAAAAGSASTAFTAAPDGGDACMDGETVVRTLLQILGACIWSGRAKAECGAETVDDSLARSVGTGDANAAAIHSSWLWQNWWESGMSVTDGQRKMQESIVQFLYDTWASPAAAPSAQGGGGGVESNAAQWRRLLLSVITESMAALPTLTSQLPSSSSSDVNVSPADDGLCFQVHASLRLMAGVESFLRPGSRISLRLSEDAENADLDTHQDLVERMAGGEGATSSLSASASASTAAAPVSAGAGEAGTATPLSTRTNAFDFGTILHGYVRSFAPAPMGTLGASPFLSVEVLRELDAAADAADPGANVTNLQMQGNSAYNESVAAAVLGGSASASGSGVTYTVVPTSLARVRPLAPRSLQLSKLLSDAHSKQVQQLVLAVLHAAVARSPEPKFDSQAVVLVQLQYECMRVLCAQLSNGSWLMDPADLCSLMTQLQRSCSPGMGSAAPAGNTFDLDVTSPPGVPRTDVAFQALALQGSAQWRMEQAALEQQGQFRPPPAFASVAPVVVEQAKKTPAAAASAASVDGATAGGAAAAAAAEEAEIPQPALLGALENLCAMGYTLPQSRAALMRAGSADIVAAVELILSEDEVVLRGAGEAEWAEFLEAAGVRINVELFLRQQARKRENRAGASAPTAAAAAGAPDAPSLHWTCPRCTTLNLAVAALCVLCRSARPEPAAAGATATAASSAPADARAGTRPRNWDPESIFLGPVPGGNDRDTSGVPLRRTPLVRALAGGRSVLGAYVSLRAPLSTLLPHCTLHHGIVVKVVPVEDAQSPAAAAAAAPSLASSTSAFSRVGSASAASSSSPASASTAAATGPRSVHGMVLVRFAGSLRSSQPAPVVLAWVCAADLLLEPLQPFDLATAALAAAYTTEPAELRRRAVDSCNQAMERLAKTTLAQMARREMTRPRAVSTAPVGAAPFTLAQLLSILPTLLHPVDSLPGLVKPASKQRFRLAEDVAAYLLRDTSSSPTPAGQSQGQVTRDAFERFLAQGEEVLDGMRLDVDLEVRLPSSDAQPLCLVPVAASAAAAVANARTASSSSSSSSSSSAASAPSNNEPASAEAAPVPGLVLVSFRSDAWVQSARSSSALSFYADAGHTRLLRQVIFPPALDSGVSGASSGGGARTPPAPFLLPTPCYVSWSDLDEKPLPLSDPAGSALLAEVVHVSPWSVGGLNHAVLLADLVCYLCTQSARSNGLGLEPRQKQQLQMRLGFPLADRLMRLATDALAPQGYFPGNVALVCVSLLGQLFALWSGLGRGALPPQIRGALRGTASRQESAECDRMARALAAGQQAASAARMDGSGAIPDALAQPLPTSDSHSSLFLRLLSLDALVYSQVLERFASESAQTVSSSHYLLTHMECMVALRLLLAAHTVVAAPPNFCADLKFDLAWSGKHLLPLRSQEQREDALERGQATKAREAELAEFAHAHGASSSASASSSAPGSVSSLGSEDARRRDELILAVMMSRAAEQQAEVAPAHELLLVENMVHMLRRASGKPKRMPLPRSVLSPQPHASVSPATTARNFLSSVFGTLPSRPDGAPRPSAASPPTASDAAASPSSVAAAAPVCELCEEVPAALRCSSCNLVLCAECDGDMHEQERRSRHTRTPIEKIAAAPAAAANAAPPATPSAAASSASAAASPVAAAVASASSSLLGSAAPAAPASSSSSASSSAAAADVARLQTQLNSSFQGIVLQQVGDEFVLRRLVDADGAAADAAAAGTPVVTVAPLPASSSAASAPEASAPGPGAAASSAPPAEASEQHDTKLDGVCLGYLRLDPYGMLGNLILGGKVEGARWGGVQSEEAEGEGDGAGLAAAASASSSSSTAPPALAPSLDRGDSSNQQSESASLREPLSALLVPSTSARLQLFHSLLSMTRTRDRTAPEISFDTSSRWEERLNDPTAAGVAAIAKGKAAASASGGKAAATSASSSSARLSLFEQLVAQLSVINPLQLRGPLGEYSWRASFVGAADEGAQGYVGLFKQSVASLTTQLVAGAYRADSLSSSLLIVCPNGLGEVGENRNQLILNPALLSAASLKRFYCFGQLLACAVRSQTCMALDLSALFWRLLVHGADALLAGPADAATRSALRELQSIDANAAAMLRYVLREADEAAFRALALSYTTYLSGGAVLVDLLPGGSHRPVAFADRAHYVRLVLYARFNESAAAMQAIRLGLRSLLPSTSPLFCTTTLGGGDQLSEFPPSPGGPLSLLRAADLELLVCGAPEVDLGLLRAHTTVKGAAADSPLMQQFWEVLDSFSPADRARFLQFAWGRARLPAHSAALAQRMTVNVVPLPSWWAARFPTAETAAAASVDDANALRLPRSQTCFFLVDLPHYPNVAILRHKLTRALDCTDINF